MFSRPSERFAGYTASTPNASSSADSPWEGQGPGISGCIIPRPGAPWKPARGFVETRKYAKLCAIPDYQEKALRIYDAVDYFANARDVPMAGYGGED